MEIIAILLTLIYLVILFYLYAKIAKKAGYSGWWALSMIIPLVGIIMVWALAFSKWPIEKINNSDK